MDACLGFYDDNYYTYDIEAALEEETETELAPEEETETELAPGEETETELAA
jgi:hypothetical protein